MEQIFRAIPSVLNGLGPNAEISEAMVFAAWTRCAGELIRERTAPIEFYDRRLVIAVSDLTWQRHLEDLCPRMLASLNNCLGHGTITFIEFRIDESAVRGNQEIRKVSKSEEQPAGLAISLSLKNAADAISDEGLRTIFLSAAADYLAKQERNAYMKFHI